MLSKNEIKYIRSLQVKKHRETEGKFIAEGAKWIEELLHTQPGWIENIYATDKWVKPAGKQPIAEAALRIEAYEMEKISALTHPGAVLALVRIPDTPQIAFDENSWNLVLDGIQDPGNFGSIVRIADWFGLKTLWCSKDCVDAYNTKVVQATMGSLCRINVIYTDLEKLPVQTPLPWYATAMHGKNVFGKMPEKGVLVIGNEGQGVRPELMAKATEKLTIPRIGKAESLNAAVATGILLSHLIPEKS